MKINVVECQHHSVIKALELGVTLDENMPDIEKVFVEPTNSLFQNYDENEIFNHLPALIINIGAEEVVGETGETNDFSVVDGKVVGTECCSNNAIVRQFFNIDVVVEQCEGVYALAGKVSCSFEQIMCHLKEFRYSGNFVQVLDDQISDDFYIKTYSYYIEYEK